MSARYVVVVTALDGTKSVCGPFRDEYAATLASNELETEDTGWIADVCELESPAEVSGGSAVQVMSARVVTPSPEMRSAVLAAAGLTDDLDDGGDDVTDTLAGDELMAWRMTPRTQQVILAALEVASRLPAQRAECERVAAIVRSAGGIHCPDCGPHRYGKHGIGHAFSETGGE